MQIVFIRDEWLGHLLYEVYATKNSAVKYLGHIYRKPEIGGWACSFDLELHTSEEISENVPFNSIKREIRKFFTGKSFEEIIEQ